MNAAMNSPETPTRFGVFNLYALMKIAVDLYTPKKFGAVLCDDSLLHVLIVKKDQQPPQCCCCCNPPPAPAMNPSTELMMA